MTVGRDSKRDAFPPPDHDRWAALAQKALGEVPFAEAMASRTDGGVAIEALRPRRADAPVLGRRDPAACWSMMQRVDDPDAARANRQALADIDQGAGGLSLVFEGAPNAFGYGLPDRPDTLERVLDGVPLNRIHLRIDPHPSSRAMADRVVAFLTGSRADPNRLELSFGIDSAAVFAGTGRLRMSLEALQASMPQSLSHFFAMGVPGVLLEADGRVFHNAGATEVQELGIMLAGAVAHLRLFQSARQALVYGAPHIGFAVSVDQDQFVSMAKIRALRLLWRRAQEACGIEPCEATIHAETSYRMLTRLDPETNILRSTIAAFAAAAGGADSLCVLPHTLTHGLPAGLARRIARNTQLVLAQESHLDFPSDPASGSGNVEALTEALCAAAWAEFQRIEQEGGILRSLADGGIQERVLDARAERMRAYRAGGRAIVGTTLYRMPAEPPVETLPAERRPAPTDGTVFCRRLDATRIDELLEAQA